MQVMSTPIKAALERVAHQKLPLPYPPDHETKGQQLATTGSQFASCVGRRLSHQPTIPTNAIKTSTLPRRPANRRVVAATTAHMIAAVVRTGAEAGKSKHEAPATHATRITTTQNDNPTRSNHNNDTGKDLFLEGFFSIVATLDIEPDGYCLLDLSSVS